MTHESDGEYGLSQTKQAEEFPAPAYEYLPKLPPSYRPAIGLIGAGGISEYHLRAYRKLGLNVKRICDLDLQRAQNRRDEYYPDSEATSDATTIWDDREIEVVDIATHPKTRFELIESGLRAGKHVLSQKPFSLDLDRGTRLADLADECGKKLAVNQNGRWAPHFRYIVAAIEAGLVGPVSPVDFSLQWDHRWTIDTPFNDIHHLVLYDFAIHWFDIVTTMLTTQEPETVYASVRRTSYQKAKPPFLAHVAIDYPSAQVTMGFNAHAPYGQEDRTIVSGRDGILRAFGPGVNEQAVEIWTAQGKSVPELTGDWFSNGFEGTMSELLCAIVEDREPRHSARRNLKSLELCFAAVASANQNRLVRVGEIRQLDG